MLYSHDGLLLRDTGRLARSANCCCDPEPPTPAIWKLTPCSQYEFDWCTRCTLKPRAIESITLSGMTKNSACYEYDYNDYRGIDGGDINGTYGPFPSYATVAQTCRWREYFPFAVTKYRWYPAGGCNGDPDYTYNDSELSMRFGLLSSSNYYLRISILAESVFLGELPANCFAEEEIEITNEQTEPTHVYYGGTATIVFGELDEVQLLPCCPGGDEFYTDTDLSQYSGNVILVGGVCYEVDSNDTENPPDGDITNIEDDYVSCSSCCYDNE